MPHVVFVAPAAAGRFFRRVVGALGHDVAPSYHDMLLATAALPDPTWSLRAEAKAFAGAIEALESFHVVAYSGAAAVVLRYLMSGQDLSRIQSLTLAEPPWVGLDFWSDAEREFVEEFDRLITLPPLQLFEAFAALYAAPTAGLAPPTDLERTALELRTCWSGYRAETLERDAFRAIGVPVYLPVGAKSPSRMREAAGHLAGVFPRARVEIIEGSGHFDLLFTGANQAAAGIRRCFS